MRYDHRFTVGCGEDTSEPRDFILLYDNQDGTGQSLSATFVENDGSSNTSGKNYVAFYTDSVNTVDGAFGTIIPNTNANGVRRVERRSAAGNMVAFALSNTELGSAVRTR